MKESEFVADLQEMVTRILKPPLSVRRGEALLYQVAVDNKLEVTVNPKRPTRGQSAFETDLCVFEDISNHLSIPRVVDRKSTRLNSSHIQKSRMPSSA